MTHDPEAPAFLPQWPGLEPNDLAEAGFFGPSATFTYASDGVEINEHPVSVMSRDEKVASVVDHFFTVGCKAPDASAIDTYAPWFVEGWSLADAAFKREVNRRKEELAEEQRRKNDLAGKGGLRHGGRSSLPRNRPRHSVHSR